MAKSKTDLESEIKKLKQEIRELRSEVKTTDKVVEGLNSEGFGVIIRDKEYYLVNLKFDAIQDKAVITSITSLSNSIAGAINVSQKALGKHIVELSKRHNGNVTK